MPLIEREKYLSLLKDLRDQHLIKIITGVRRCGKSTLLGMFMDYLRRDNATADHIIYLNFENVDYEDLYDRHKLHDYLKNHIISDDHKTYIFLDEIQHVNEFEIEVDSLFTNPNLDIYITGSNARLLSHDLATLLSGRYVEIKMLPLSFKEYMSAFPEESPSLKFQDYLRYSSFPQSVELYKTNPNLINTFMDGLYNSILIKDVMTRKNVSDQLTLEKVSRYLFDNIGNSTSVLNITNNLNGVASYNVVSMYVSSLCDACLIYPVRRYDIKGKEILKTQEKYYLVDIGLRYHLLGMKAGRDMGHILENIVYLELIRRGYQVYIGKYDDKEIDFVAINNEGTTYVQVADTVRDENTLKRELTPLLSINDSYPKYILTMDDDMETEYDGVRKLNLLSWLLK